MRTLTLAHGTPVLAEDLLAEQVADAGGRVWVANPIDAFRTSDQRLYVDWLRGRPAGDAALAHAPRAVLVRLDSKAEHRLRSDARFRRVASDTGAVLYLRVAQT
jgi:anaerobic selenocysteine-containing dehydrogenase